MLPIAKSLKVDPAHLMRLVLEQYWPRYLHTIEEIFGLTVSRNEKRLILMVRKLTRDADPEFVEEEEKRFVGNNKD